MKLNKTHFAIAEYFFAIAIFVVCTSYATALFLSTYPGSWLPYAFAAQALLDVALAFALAAFLKNHTHTRSVALHHISALLILVFIFLLQTSWYLTPFVISVVLLNLGVLISVLSWTNIRPAFDIIEFKRIGTWMLATSTISTIIFGLIIYLLLKIFNANSLLFLLIILLLLTGFCLQQLQPLPTKIKTLKKGTAPLNYDLYRKFFVAMFVLTVCFTFAEYSLKYELGQVYNEAQIGRFMGIFLAICNIITLIITVFLTQPLLNRYGIRSLFLSLPIYWFLTALAVILHSSLTTVTLMAAGETVFAYSTFNLGRELIFNVMPLQLRVAGQFQLKATAIPMAQGIAALLLFLFAPKVGIPGVAIWIAILSIILIGYSWLLGASYVRTLKQEILLKRFDIANSIHQPDIHLLENAVRQALTSKDPALISFGYSLLPKLKLDHLMQIITPHLESNNEDIRIDAIETIRVHNWAAKAPILLHRFQVETNPEIKGLLMKALAKLKPLTALDLARAHLNDPISELRTAAVSVLIQLGNSEDLIASLKIFIEMLNDPDVRMRRGASLILGSIHIGNLKCEVETLINDQDTLVSSHAIEAAAKSMPGVYVKRIIPRITQGHITPVSEKALLNLKKDIFPIIKHYIELNLKITNKHYSPLIRLLFAINDPETETYLLGLATSENVILKLAVAKEMAYQARRTTHNKSTKQSIYKIITDEIAKFHTLNYYKNRYASLNLLAEFDNRIYLTQVRFLYWLAIYTNPNTILDLIPVLLSNDQLERAKALELLIQLIKEPRFIKPTLALLSNKPITSSYFKNPPSELSIDNWLTSVINYSKKKGSNMETIQKVFTLRKVDLFKELPGEILFIIAEEMEATEMSQGQIVFNEGDPPTGLYIVVSGEVEILKGQDIIATLKEANFFGELALIDNSTRSATARAKGEGMLLFLEKDVFDRITEDIPEVLRVVVQTIVSYLRKYISVDKIVQSQPIAPG